MLIFIYNFPSSDIMASSDLLSVADELTRCIKAVQCLLCAVPRQFFSIAILEGTHGNEEPPCIFIFAYTKQTQSQNNHRQQEQYTIAEEAIIHSVIYQHYFDRELIKVYSCPPTFSGTFFVFVSSLPV